MADESSSLHIDTDWKKQAQEEKRRLAEAAQKREEQERATRPPPAAPMAAPSQPGARQRGGREVPQASIAALIQSVMTQAMLYLGEIAPSGMEPMLNLDMARHQVDLLGVLEEKTQGNLNDEERHLLDAALYETRARFISAASQLI